MIHLSRLPLWLLSVFFLLGGLTAQQATTRDLPAGATVVDNGGRSVTNGGTNKNGAVDITFTGKWEHLSGNEYRVHGEITNVTNPASGGSNGPIDVNTNGRPTEVEQHRNGSPEAPLTVNVTGGKADVTVTGNNTETTVGGTENDVDLGGKNNTMTGPAGSAGTVTITGKGNSVNVQGGNWKVGAA